MRLSSLLVFPHVWGSPQHVSTALPVHHDEGCHQQMTQELDASLEYYHTEQLVK